MNKLYYWVIGGITVVAVLLLVYVLYFLNQDELAKTREQSATSTIQPQPSVTSTNQTDNQSQEPSETSQVVFSPENYDNIKSAHYVSSEPVNNAKLDSPPLEVLINFNFVLAPPSEIRVTNNGQGVTTGGTSISDDRYTLSVPIEADSGNNYSVNYTACWPDGSCHDGSFGFSVLP